MPEVGIVQQAAEDPQALVFLHRLGIWGQSSHQALHVAILSGRTGLEAPSRFGRSTTT